MKRVLENPEILNLRMNNPPNINVNFSNVFHACFETLDRFKERCSLTGMQNVNLTRQQIANQIEFYFFCKDYDAPHEVPTSSTSYTRDPTNVSSKIYYCPDDLALCPDIIEARFAHECMHAIRRVLAIAMNIKPLTPKKTPLPGENRYKLTRKSFHSGYLVEHELYGGIVVYLEPEGRLLKDDRDQIEIRLPKYAKIRCVEEDAVGFMDRLWCHIWDSIKSIWEPESSYLFEGTIITRDRER